jgi:hypothetical protein
MFVPTLMLALSLPGCIGPSYSEVERIDTIEAYEAFLEADPDTFYRNPIEKRLEELYWDKTSKEDTLEAWAAYTKRWEGTKAAHYPQALKRHGALAWRKALDDGSVEALNAYADEFGRADQTLASRARGMIAALEYGKLELGEPKIARVNLGEDPKGPLNGWGISVDVTNAGEATLKVVRLSVMWTKSDGTEIATRDYPLVSDRWTMPATEEQQRPIKPGEKRTWVWTEDFAVLPEDATPIGKVFPSGLEPVK